MFGRNEDAFESQFLRFGDTLLDAVDGADLSGQSHFAAETSACVERDVHVTAQDGSEHRQVDCRVLHFESAGDVKEHIFLQQFEPYAFLQDRQQHVESSAVKTCR